ncbi:MAG: hypothetical protein HOL60_07730 [Pelagibacteraceae bacterium]|jgi:hypothetical protein|nr:hypothetical protein [Pelagibacteraceae bacterium]
MAFFSFSLLKNRLTYFSNEIEPNQKYFSKDITLWKELKNINKKKQICVLNHENRLTINSLGKKILIFLPPRFGLGDAIEYSIAINSIIKSKKFFKIGIAFCDNHYFIFKELFLFSNIYPLIISEKEIQKYDTIFHITLEIESLKFQKYKRSNIVEEVCKYFQVPVLDFKFKQKKIVKKTIKEIAIFPVSTSMLRSLPYNILEQIIKKFQDEFIFKVYIDDSDFSKYLEEKNKSKNCVFVKPKDIKSLVLEIEKIDFGVFVDSGPLHIAKIFDKKGILIETSVSSKILLSNSKKIDRVENKYQSNFCYGPCGLVDVFSLNNRIGCYENHKISFKYINNLSNFKSLQRWNKKNNNSQLISNPVGCIRNINVENILKILEDNLREY